MALLALAAQPPSADAQRRFDFCSLPNDQTVVRSDFARVFIVDPKPRNQDDFENDYRAYACLLRSRQSVLLGRYLAYSGNENGPYLFRLAGRYVVYDYLHCYKRECGGSIRIRDLKSGRVVRRIERAPPSTYSSPIVDLELKRNGSVAWIQHIYEDLSGRSATEVWARDGHGRHLLDTGPDIESGSLRLSGRTLTWLNAGEPRSAPLH